MKRTRLILNILLLTVNVAFAQELRLVVNDKPLNTILNTLGVEISFDDNALSVYKVSVSKTFSTPEEAIHFLLKGKPFEVEKVGNVFVITPLRNENKKLQIVTPKYTISGWLSDKSTGESLPYACIRTDKGTISTDKSGYFSITGETDKPMQIHVQYIGFVALDSILTVGNHKLFLSPVAISLDEIVIAPSPSSMLMQSGKMPGEIRINHHIAGYMPGSADNSVFNLLRMMPGVRASGEPSEDVIVRGSNQGESRLTYDGFTIFGMKNFNDLIGSVNPYLVKDIRLSKVGYDASQGNRIGAIAEITGNDGNFNNPTVKVALNNYTANVYTSIPLINKSSALSVAYRQTFNNLHNNKSLGNSISDNHDKQPFNAIDDINPGDKNISNVTIKNNDIYTEPEYGFRDLNLKYAGTLSDNDRYYISLYGADDNFRFSARQDDYKIDATENNKQYGAAANYQKIWGNSSKSNFLFTYSKLSSAIDNGIAGYQEIWLDTFHIKNAVQELSLNYEHNLNIGQRQNVQIGGVWQYNTTSLYNNRTSINNPALYVTDNIALGKLSLKAGVRADIISGNKVYIQPRLSVQYTVSEEITTTASFGLYNQFLTRVPYQYNTGSFRMLWNLSNGKPLSSIHTQAGITYSKNCLLVSIEGYLKKNKNPLKSFGSNIPAFNNMNTGIDFFVKKEWEKQTFFCSYSLAYFTYPLKTTGSELKTGIISCLKPFYFSATYVYGTNFPYLFAGEYGYGLENDKQYIDLQKYSDTTNKPYSRLDLSLLYKVAFRKVNLQAGVSVLNVYNTENVKFSYLVVNPNNASNIYAKAMPFTPVVFFEIIF